MVNLVKYIFKKMEMGSDQIKCLPTVRDDIEEQLTYKLLKIDKK
jgi:hypothetical protein